MSDFLQNFQDPSFRLSYSLGGAALLLLPMLLLALWYHPNIKKTPGGRALMERQGKSNVRSRGSFLSAQSQMADGIAIMRDVKSGRYGQQARRMQTRVNWVVGLWVLAVALYFGLMIYADELARVPT
jgi:hypothetical protein